MARNLKRSIETRQIKMRQMNFFVNGTAGAGATASGFDQFGIKSVTNTGTGVWEIVFNDDFERDDIIVYLETASAAGMSRPTNMSKSGFTARTVNTSASVANLDFYITVIGSEFGYDV